MSDSDRRKKMISLRLSETEYAALKAQYRTYGARNISDLARLALQKVISTSAAPSDTLADKVMDLDQRLHTLESQMALLLDGDLERV
jgi:hypothetical protein